MELNFKQFVEGFATQAKIGLYPPLMDALGQYPPLYGIPRASDMITYIYLNYPNGIPGKNGVISYAAEHPHAARKGTF